MPLLHANVHAPLSRGTAVPATKTSAKMPVFAPTSRRATAGKRRPSVPKGSAVSIAHVRDRLGVSQDELSRMTGYSVRAIAGWEAGRK